MICKWRELRATIVPEVLEEYKKKPWPKCGIKYTRRYGHGLVFVKSDVTDLDLIKDKARAASDKISYVFTIPKNVEKIYRLNVPTLTEKVA
jgi:hypothetical protein